MVSLHSTGPRISPSQRTGLAGGRHRQRPQHGRAGRSSELVGLAAGGQRHRQQLAGVRGPEPDEGVAGGDGVDRLRQPAPQPVQPGRRVARHVAQAEPLQDEVDAEHLADRAVGLGLLGRVERRRRRPCRAARPGSRPCPRTAAGRSRRRPRTAAGSASVRRWPGGGRSGRRRGSRRGRGRGTAAAAAAGVTTSPPGRFRSCSKTSSAGEVDLDEGEAAHERVRHVEQQVLVEHVHRGDDPPARRDPDDVGVLGRLDAVGHERERLGLAGPLERQHDRLARQDGEELAEGAVEVRPVELVDHEPAAGLDRLDEQAGPEDEALGRWAGSRRWSRRSSTRVVAVVGR